MAVRIAAEKGGKNSFEWGGGGPCTSECIVTALISMMVFMKDSRSVAIHVTFQYSFSKYKQLYSVSPSNSFMRMPSHGAFITPRCCLLHQSKLANNRYRCQDAK